MAPPTAIHVDQKTPEGESRSHKIIEDPLDAIAAGSRVKKQALPSPPVFEDKYKERAYLKGRLAAAFRIFGKYGFDEGVAGHITLRDPVEPDTFWVNPFGIAFSLIHASDLIRVDESGEVIDGGQCRLLNAAAFAIHSAIHQARPDVIAACHSHSIYGRAMCTLGKLIDPLTQDSCAFYNDLALYDSFNGVVIAEQEGKDIAKCLGSKKAALLQNHGLLTVGHSVEEAVFWFVALDKTCQVQLLADAAAAGKGSTTVKIGQEEAEFTRKLVGSHKAGFFSAKPLFDVIHKETGGEYLE